VKISGLVSLHRRKLFGEKDEHDRVRYLTTEFSKDERENIPER
jgi:hypothetical protein